MQQHHRCKHCPRRRQVMLACTRRSETCCLKPSFFSHRLFVLSFFPRCRMVSSGMRDAGYEYLNIVRGLAIRANSKSTIQMASANPIQTQNLTVPALRFFQSGRLLGCGQGSGNQEADCGPRRISRGDQGCCRLRSLDGHEAGHIH
jgi:hypothetical protein